MAKTAAGKERERCIGIVREYRRELTEKLALKPDALNQDQVIRLIRRLQKIEHEMARPYGATDTYYAANATMIDPNRGTKYNLGTEPVLPGDFSIEEMDRAHDIIAEQEKNPFEEG